MLLSEFLQTRSQSIINQPVESVKSNISAEVDLPKVNEKGNSFAEELRTMPVSYTHLTLPTNSLV